ncbi:hypothetical protein RND81_09G111100 [Saponaria officinalis]|uniref:Uncharacterized protein n=1 Tax=Saponaria officinalis TaxID=3572 RepID=A0AAW1IJI5_SAPOF
MNLDYIETHTSGATNLFSTKHFYKNIFKYSKYESRFTRESYFRGIFQNFNSPKYKSQFSRDSNFGGRFQNFKLSSISLDFPETHTSGANILFILTNTGTRRSMYDKTRTRTYPSYKRHS